MSNLKSEKVFSSNGKRVRATWAKGDVERFNRLHAADFDTEVEKLVQAEMGR